MAAEAATFLARTRTGEHIVCIGDVYGGTFELLGDNLPQVGITTHISTERDALISAPQGWLRSG
ncbi:PLP-dependent transferase [Streptomyces avermitilis]|uniref:PLP-dependent transferase n=1 Tax=Streptomyces avermitilis TaxID=33903 RepID=UPI0037209F39